MFNFLIKILDFVYKKKCYFCGSSHENALMCQRCYDKIAPFAPGVIQKILGVNIYVCCFYEKEMQRLIRGIKYHGKKELAKYQARFMYEYFRKINTLNVKYLIVPVPLHKKRYKQRKYNHMEEVAKELAILTGWDVCTDLIVRIKETKPQYKLKTKQRQENLHNAFKVFDKNYNGENILIIDDILTTGSTLSEIIKTFHNVGIVKLTGLITSTVHGNSVNIQ